MLVPFKKVCRYKHIYLLKIKIYCSNKLIYLSSYMNIYTLELLTAAVFLGMLIGGIACGLFSDHFGRRPTLLG